MFEPETVSLMWPLYSPRRAKHVPLYQGCMTWVYVSENRNGPGSSVTKLIAPGDTLRTWTLTVPPVARHPVTITATATRRSDDRLIRIR